MNNTTITTIVTVNQARRAARRSALYQRSDELYNSINNNNNNNTTSPVENNNNPTASSSSTQEVAQGPDVHISTEINNPEVTIQFDLHATPVSSNQWQDMELPTLNTLGQRAQETAVPVQPAAEIAENIQAHVEQLHGLERHFTTLGNGFREIALNIRNLLSQWPDIPQWAIYGGIGVTIAGVGYMFWNFRGTLLPGLLRGIGAAAVAPQGNTGGGGTGGTATGGNVVINLGNNGIPNVHHAQDHFVTGLLLSIFGYLVGGRRRR